MTTSNAILFNNISLADRAGETGSDLDAILHPGRVFTRPMDVVHHPTLSLPEKRAILASWASDACAIEAAPALRVAPGGEEPVRFDEVMDALGALDRLSGTEQSRSQRTSERRSFPRRRPWTRTRESGSSDGSVPLA